MMEFLHLIVIFILPIAFSAPSVDLDPEDNDTLEEFEAHFHLPKITDPVEHQRREKALKKAEAMVKEVNEEFIKGKKTWTAALYEDSDLTEEEFEQEKTGLIEPFQYSRGLVNPPEAERVDDEESERYFASVRTSMETDRDATPSSWNSVSMGIVSEVKNQKQCGACVAFANMAAIETCFKNLTGVFGDYSEQQMIDCNGGANPCKGTYMSAYLKWAAYSGKDLISEADYPYKNKNPSLTCPADIPRYNQGAKVSGLFATWNGDEEMLKTLVTKHGAVVSTVSAYGPLQHYKSGVFAGCNSTKTDHCITVVGYGTDEASGMDYWLIKNSWGAHWGEDGYIRLQRGVGMCSIGKELAVVKCAKVPGPTDASITTEVSGSSN